MERSLKGFRGVVGWRSLSVLVGLVGGLRLRLRQGLTLVRNFDPGNREKILGAPPPATEEDDEEADFDGGLYAGKKSKSGTHSNEGASDSRRNQSSASRTSPSASDRAHHHQPIPNPGGPKSKHPQSRSSSNTSSQSPSLPSPSSPAFSKAQTVSPSTVEQGQGFFDLEDALPVREGGFPGRIGGGEFPVGRIGGGNLPIGDVDGV